MYLTQPPNCDVTVPFKFAKPDCKHNAVKKCHQKESDIMCMEKVNYNFPKCGHPSPMRKACSEPIAWVCKTVVYAKGRCGHDIRKECSQALDTVECSFRPCAKLRNCGHPCTNICGKDCNFGECGSCEEVRKKELRKMQHR